VAPQRPGAAEALAGSYSAHDEPPALDGLGEMAGESALCTGAVFWNLPHSVPVREFEYAEARRQQAFMKGVLNRMLNRQLSMAWEQWQQWYAELKAQNPKLCQWLQLLKSEPLVQDQQFRLAGAIRRMMNRELSAAWEKWQVRTPLELLSHHTTTPNFSSPDAHNPN
jgi:hypothetical protein